MQQAISSLSRLFEDYQAAAVEKRRVYALAREATEVKFDAAEGACDVAHGTVEGIADAIFAIPAASAADATIKARVLLARGADPADLFYYRPGDLIRFVQEVAQL